MTSASSVTRLRASIEAREAAFGAWLTLPGTQLARTCANAAGPSCAFIIIDCEHGLIPLQGGLQETVMAIALSSATSPSPLVRISATEASDSTAWQIKLALDSGAHGVICPMVSTAAKAREIAAEARFPPLGRRGIGSHFAHEAWKIARSLYIPTANAKVVVLVQIETQQAVDNIDEILEVSGIDGVLIGPYDLSLSTGNPLPNPRPAAPVESLIQKVKEACKARKKLAGMVCISPSDARARGEEGFDIITVTSDTSTLLAGLAASFAQLSSSPRPLALNGY